MNQKDGVFAAVLAVCGPNFNQPILEHVSDGQLKDIHDLVVAEFQAGNIEYRGGCPAEERIRKYVPSLVNNWMRKDLRLNGGKEYEPKRPGSRQGSGDEQLRNLKALLELVPDATAKAEIRKAIEQRTMELEAAKRPTVDITKVPEHLRKYYTA